jgi:hypothetical protein
MSFDPYFCGTYVNMDTWTEPCMCGLTRSRLFEKSVDGFQVDTRDICNGAYVGGERARLCMFGHFHDDFEGRIEDKTTKVSCHHGWAVNGHISIYAGGSLDSPNQTSYSEKSLVYTIES